MILYAVILFIFLAVGYLLSLRISRPITEINNAARKIAAGDLESIVQYESTDELGSLVNSFNIMTREIRKSKEQLVLSNKELKAEITERFQFEKKLKELNIRLQTLLQAIPDIVFFKDLQGRYLLANKAFEEFTGKSQEELLGKTDAETLPAELADYCKKSDAETMRAQKPLCFGEEFTDNAGKTRSFDTIKAPIYNNDGEIIGMVGVSRDITERKMAEEELIRSEKKLNDITSNLGEGIYVLSENGEVAFMNPEAERLLGWTFQELKNKNIHDTIHYQKEDGTPLPFEDCPVYKVIKTGNRFFSQDEVFTRRDGTTFPVSIISSPITEDGKIIATVTGFRDISERKRLEREVIKAQNLESLGILAGGIAHDFNNLLQGILGNISVAKIYLNPNDTAYSFIQRAEGAHLLAKNLTGQLLTFARGGIPIKGPVLIGECLRDWIDFALTGSNIRSYFNIDEDRFVIEVDQGQLRQAIQNVVFNAREAMPDGGVLMVQAKKIFLDEKEGIPLKEGLYAKISIKDQGRGIPQKYLSKIFDPYFSTKNIGNRKGMGLGLTISYSIVKNHGGIITVESRENAGTTFHIYLPISDKDVIEEKTESAEKYPIQKGKVLIMDDEKLVAEVAGTYLKELGYDFEFARDGAEAIDMYNNAEAAGSPFDTVILDLTIPGGMGGRGTVKKLLEINPDVKVIVSSGYSEDQALTEYRKYGFSGALTKPYTIGELRKVLSKVLTQS